MWTKLRFLFLLCLSIGGLNAQIAVYPTDSLMSGDLSGQDNWQTTLSGTTVDVKVESGYSHDGGKGIRFTKNGGGVNASFNRPLNTAFPGFTFTDTSSVYYLYADIKREYWGAEIGIGFDANNDGVINTASSSTEKAIRLKFAASNTTGTTFYTLTGQALTYPAIGSGWSRIEIKFDLSALSGQGEISVRHKLVAATSWDTLFVNKAMGCVYANQDVKNPNTWNQVFMHFTGSSSGLDNLEIWKMTPNALPSALSLDNDSIAENNPVGTFVANLTTVDADTLDTHSYTLVAGAGDTDNASFTISGDSLLTNAMFDFETKNVYQIRLKVEDQKGGSREEQKMIYIKDLIEIGILENQLKNVEVYPNPAIDLLNVNLGNSNFGIVDVEVFSLTGQIIYQQREDATSNLQIDVSDFKKGEYVVYLKSENGEERQAKFIVQ